MALLKKRVQAFDIHVQDMTLRITASADLYEECRASAMQFWDQLKGSGDGSTTGYMIYWDLDSAWSTHITRCTVLLGESLVLTHTFSNIGAGDSVLTITIRDAFGTSLHVQSFDVVVG